MTKSFSLLSGLDSRPLIFAELDFEPLLLATFDNVRISAS